MLATSRAARAGNAQVIKCLVSRGCPLNAQSLKGETALHWASRGVKIDAIKELIGQGASTHLRNNESRSALDVAAAGFPGDGDHNVDTAKAMLLSGIAKGHPAEEVAHDLREKVRRTIFEAEPRMRTLVAYHHECSENHSGRYVLERILTMEFDKSSKAPFIRSISFHRKDTWDNGGRVETIMSRLKDPERFPSYLVDITSGFERASVEAVSRVHSAEYVHFVHELSKEATQQGGSPIPFHPFVPKPNSGSPLPQVDSKAMTVSQRESRNC